MDLVAKMRAKQQEFGLSDQKFARLMGVSYASWNSAKRGDIEMGWSLCRAVTRVFPDLEGDVLAYMRQKHTGSQARTEQLA